MCRTRVNLEVIGCEIETISSTSEAREYVNGGESLPSVDNCQDCIALVQLFPKRLSLFQLGILQLIDRLPATKGTHSNERKCSSLSIPHTISYYYCWKARHPFTLHTHAKQSEPGAVASVHAKWGYFDAKNTEIRSKS